MSELGLLVPIVAMGIPISAIWAKHRTRIAELNLRGNAGAAAETTAQIARLEERVRVLERIVTDGGKTRELADEIERLR